MINELTDPELAETPHYKEKQTILPNPISHDHNGERRLHTPIKRTAEGKLKKPCTDSKKDPTHPSPLVAVSTDDQESLIPVEEAVMASNSTPIKQNTLGESKCKSEKKSKTVTPQSSSTSKTKPSTKDPSTPSSKKSSSSRGSSSKSSSNHRSSNDTKKKSSSSTSSKHLSGDGSSNSRKSSSSSSKSYHSSKNDKPQISSTHSTHGSSVPGIINLSDKRSAVPSPASTPSQLATPNTTPDITPSISPTATPHQIESLSESAGSSPSETLPSEPRVQCVDQTINDSPVCLAHQLTTTPTTSYLPPPPPPLLPHHQPPPLPEKPSSQLLSQNTQIPDEACLLHYITNAPSFPAFPPPPPPPPPQPEHMLSPSQIPIPPAITNTPQVIQKQSIDHTSQSSIPSAAAASHRKPQKPQKPLRPTPPPASTDLLSSIMARMDRHPS